MSNFTSKVMTNFRFNKSVIDCFFDQSYKKIKEIIENYGEKFESLEIEFGYLVDDDDSFGLDSGREYRQKIWDVSTEIRVSVKYHNNVSLIPQRWAKFSIENAFDFTRGIHCVKQANFLIHSMRLIGRLCENVSDLPEALVEKFGSATLQILGDKKLTDIQINNFSSFIFFHGQIVSRPKEKNQELLITNCDFLEKYHTMTPFEQYNIIYKYVNNK